MDDKALAGLFVYLVSIPLTFWILTKTTKRSTTAKTLLSLLGIYLLIWYVPIMILTRNGKKKIYTEREKRKIEIRANESLIEMNERQKREKEDRK